MTLRARKNIDFLPLRALHKVYRLGYENPRRRKLRKVLLGLPPHQPGQLSTEISIHTLICSSHVEMLVCSQRSLYGVSDFGSAPLLLHDDGSLTDAEASFLVDMLPNAKVIRRREADEKARKVLPANSVMLKFRDAQVMALKLVDVRLWARGQRTCYIDSDILFFESPEELIQSTHPGANRNLFNRDIDDAYVQPPEVIEKAVGVAPAPRVNAGLWSLNTSVIDLERVEDWLANPVFARRPFNYRLEQTLISMLASISPQGCEYFSPEYDVDLFKSPADCCVKHYAGPIRHGFELEGITHLLTNTDFVANWHDRIC